MVIRWPARIRANQLRDELTQFTDWMPTLLSVCGVSRPEGPRVDGHDLAALLLGRRLQREPRQFWQWNFYFPNVGTNAAVRDGDWKMVRPMIEGTRFFSNDLCESDEDVARTAAFVEADCKHKEDPASIAGILPVPHLKPQDPEPPELYNLAEDSGETNDLAAANPDRVHRMLHELDNWFESVEADRATIDWPA